jgi:hypothetical protein
MTDPHYEYTKDQIKKNLILLEDHAKSYPCPECLSKHLLNIEGLAEEGSLMTDDERERLNFLKLAEISRLARKKLVDKT